MKSLAGAFLLTRRRPYYPHTIVAPRLCPDSWTTEATQLQVPAECSHAVTVEVKVNTEELPRMIVEEANGF